MNYFAVIHTILLTNVNQNKTFLVFKVSNHNAVNLFEEEYLS